MFFIGLKLKKKKEKNSNYRSDYTAERKQLVQRLWSHAIRENNFPNGGRGKKALYGMSLDTLRRKGEVDSTWQRLRRSHILFLPSAF